MSRHISNIGDMVPPVGSFVGLTGEFDVKVIRADGTVETKKLRNIVTRRGLNRLACRAVLGTSSLAFVLAVGTTTAVASMDSTNFGECGSGRKVAASAIQSSEWIAMQMTWAGFVDGLAGIAIDAVSILDHASSGQGISYNIANGLGTTLQNSDFLNLTGRIRVGSHNLGHTT